MKVVTPLTESATLGATSKRRVLCKLDSLQRSGSFKYRGISALAHDLKKQGKTMLVAPSGGNAGMAAATAAKDLGLECVVYVPKSTSEFMRKKLEGAGARVVVHGEHFAEADLAAKEFVAHQGAAAGYVHAFDDERIWEGHASMIDEIKEQLKGEKPDTIVVSVGGGGLLMGVVRGLLRNGWGDVQVVAVETAGAESLHQCVLQKQHVTLPGIRSIAKSLGAVRVCSAAYDLVASPNPPVVVRSMVVLDSDALEALTLFRSCPASAGKMVEPACAASLAVLMRPDLLQERDKTVVVIVCGGNAISDDLLTSYRANCFVP